MSFWYVIKVMPGKERQLNEQFNEQISLGRIRNIKRFVCPTEKNFVLVKKKKVLKEKVIYSGYLYFETENKLTDDELKYIASQPLIMGMLGDKKPLLLPESDVNRILKDELLDEHEKSKVFKVNEEVILNDTAFKGFKGTIVSIEKEDVVVEVKIFGQGTKIELKTDQILKS